MLPSSKMQALLDFRAIVGASHVLTDAADLDRAATATFATRARPSAIVRPENLSQVQDLVRAAARHGVPLYPVSRG